MTDTKLQEAENLFEARDYQKEFELLTGILATEPENVEALWRLTRCHFSLSEVVTDKAAKQDHLNKGLELIKKALSLDDKHYATHKWFAIVLGTIGEYLPTKEKIGNSFLIKEHALKALELKPGDASVLHMLGKWCYSVANIGWVERTAASALFATPPTSTFDEALDWFLKSQEALPTLRNAILIGDTYTALKQQPKAKEWYKKAAEMPFKGVTEEEQHKQALAKAK